MKRKIGAVLFVLYSIVAITVTILLLSYNDYNISQIGDYTIYIVKDDSLEPEFKKGSILIIEKTSDKHVQVGDELFLYQVINSQEFEFVTRTLSGKTQQGRHIVYETASGETFANDYFVGKTKDAIVIEGWGTLLAILESKWGYLFCIVIVSLLLFLQEVFDLVIEIKYGGTKGTKAANVAHARKTANKAPTKKKTSTTKTTTTTKVAKTTSATAKTTNTAAKTVETPAEVKATQTEE